MQITQKAWTEQQTPILTSEVHAFFSQYELPLLVATMAKKAEELPDRVEDGGDDKQFFTFNFRGCELYAAKDHNDRYTVMFPHEY